MFGYKEKFRKKSPREKSINKIHRRTGLSKTFLNENFNDQELSEYAQSTRSTLGIGLAKIFAGASMIAPIAAQRSDQVVSFIINRPEIDVGLSWNYVPMSLGVATLFLGTAWKLARDNKKVTSELTEQAILPSLQRLNLVK